jgi:hypothetical protein
LSEYGTELVDIGEQGVAGESKTVQGPLAGLRVSGSTGVGEDDRDVAEISSMRAVGSTPISNATPTTTTVVTPQSRSTMSSHVLSNADIVILSSTASRDVGASSGASWDCAASGGKGDDTSAAD